MMTVLLPRPLLQFFKVLVASASVFAAGTADWAHAQCEFRTLSQTEWGDRSNLALLTSIMNSAKVIRIGSTRKYAFNSVTAVRNFLPTSGAPKVLDRTTTNPARNKNNSLAGNLLALKLNILRDPTLGDAIVDATLPTFDHDDCIDTPHVLCYPLLASFLGNRNGNITVNEVVTLADTVTGGGRAPLNMEFVRLFQTLSAINESWGRGASAECNIIKPCGGCFVEVGLSVNDVSQIDSTTMFQWRLQDDSQNIVAQGLASAAQFQGFQWVLPIEEWPQIDDTVTVIIEQVAGSVDYCDITIYAGVYSDQFFSTSGYYQACDGSPTVCFPRFNCSGVVDICDQG